MNHSASPARPAASGCFADRTTRSTPSPPMPRCRSQSAATRRRRQVEGTVRVGQHDEVVAGAVRLGEPHGSPVVAARSAFHHRNRVRRPGPARSRPASLSAGRGGTTCAGDGRTAGSPGPCRRPPGPGHSAVQVGEHLLVSERPGRRTPVGQTLGQQRPDLVDADRRPTCCRPGPRSARPASRCRGRRRSARSGRPASDRAATPRTARRSTR